FIEVELTEWAVRFHQHPHGGALAEEPRHVAVGYPLGRDLDIGPLSWRGADRIGTPNPVTVDPPLEDQELTWPGRDRVAFQEKKAKLFRIMGLRVDPAQLQRYR